jgi:hypothetical protein
VRDVCLDRRLTEDELGRDLRVGEPAREQDQDRALAGRQLGDGLRWRRGSRAAAGELLDQPARDGGGEKRAAVGDAADRSDQLVGRAVLEQEPAGPRA